MRKGFLISEDLRKYFPINEEAVSHIWLCKCSILNFLICEENLIFLFISALDSWRKGVEEHDFNCDGSLEGLVVAMALSEMLGCKLLSTDIKYLCST
jgi:hypothetical protein